MIQPDHAERHAVDRYVFVDRVGVVEQLLGHLVVDDDHLRGVGVFSICETASRIDVAAVDVGPIRRVRLHPRVELAVLVLEGAAVGDVRRHGEDGRQPLDGVGFIDRDRRIAALGTGLVCSVARLEAANVPPVDEERGRAGRFDVAREALVDAPHDGR